MQADGELAIGGVPMSAVEVERRAGTALITLDNPDALNALSPDMVPALIDALSGAGRDRSVRAVVLTGRGDRAFCAGIDVKSVAQRDASSVDADGVDPIQRQFEHLHVELGAIIRTIHMLPVPVIAAVNGHAIGAGFAIAAACDLRVVGEGARFADGFVKRGISGCELGLSYFLPRLVGAAVAFEWMMTGRRVTAAEARACGFASTAGDGGDCVGRAIELADQLAENAPWAVSLTKEVMWANLHAGSLDQALALESRTQVMARNSADAAEARLAFLEKRPPSFASPPAARPPR